jgi:ribosome biogenesis GTPase A
MVDFQKQKQNVLQIFKAAINLANKYKHQGIQKSLEVSAKTLAEGKLLVVVCGEFKQGKSSLINALLNENNLFPVDIDIATNLVSSITYGEQEKVKIILGEPGKEQTKEISRQEIPDYVTEQNNQENFRKAQMLTIESPNPQLKEGLVLVDTPGVGGLNTEHTKIAYAFIPNADVILFVSDALRPMTQKELDFLEMIAPHCRNFIFVVTKKDLGNYQEIVDSNREKLSKILNRPGQDITIIPVSSKTKLAYLKSADAEDLEDSNFTILENTLWQMFNQQRGKILIGRALQSIAEAVSEMKSPLQAEWKACQQNPEEFAEMERQFQEVSQRLKNLQENNADWLRKLNFGVQDIKVEISNKFALGVKEVNRKADKYLDDENLLKNPVEIANRIEIDINLLMSELGKLISEKAAILHGKIEEFTGLNLNSLESISIAKGIGTFKEEDIKRSRGWEKYWTAFRGVAYSGGTVSGIGALVAQVAGKQAITMILGGPIGAVATFAILGITIAQGLSQMEQMTKREVTPVIKTFISDSQQLCNQSLNSTLTELERFMIVELTAQIKQQKDNCDRTLKSIQETRKLSKEQTERKIKELTPPLQELTKVQKAIEQFTQSIEVEGSQESAKDTGNWVDG